MTVKLTHAQASLLKLIRGATDRSGYIRKSRHAYQQTTYDVLVSRHLIETSPGSKDGYQITDAGREFLK